MAEGWFRTLRIRERGGLRRHAKAAPKGMSFEVNRNARLCIGEKNPQEVQMTSSNCPCMADLVFVFREKS
ncbi:MAG: hypothetical protein M0C28_11445 [Candidatus Moduliflexus flocculans]|nr:hypothetical protein [Candidatus Moduliflexus flocculans]